VDGLSADFHWQRCMCIKSRTRALYGHNLLLRAAGIHVLREGRFLPFQDSRPRSRRWRSPAVALAVAAFFGAAALAAAGTGRCLEEPRF